MAKADLQLSLVIPAYNESKRIGLTLEKIGAYLRTQAYSAEVIVVDDGSSDNTASLVDEAGKTFNGRLLVLRMPHRGKGHAVKSGMLAAQGRYRFLCDADLSMPIEQLERFFPVVESGIEVALGSREAAGARRFNEPGHRHTMGRIFNAVIRTLAVPGVKDTQCGFKLFSARAAEHLFAQQALDGFGFDVELLYIARKSGLRMAEVGIDWYHMQESKVRPLRDSIGMLRDVLHVRWNAVRGRYRYQVGA